MYILIENAKELPLWGIRLIGLSSKDDTKIGRFGSGLKEAIALFIRLKKNFFFYKGINRIDFAAIDVDGHEEICFKLSMPEGKYQADEWHSLNLHPNFGHHDWKEPWQAFREVLCNAMDEEEFSHSLVHQDEGGSPGYSRFYIEADMEMMEIFGGLHKKIIPLSKRKPLHFNEKGAIFTPTDNKTKIYHKGIWVRDLNNTALFDYDLSKLKLSESRTADIYDIEKEIFKCIFKMDLPHLKIVINAIFMDHNKDLIESKLSMHHLYHIEYADRDAFGKLFKEAFRDLYGANAIPVPNYAGVLQSFEGSQYKPMPFDQGFVSFCESVGFEKHEKFANNVMKLEGKVIVPYNQTVFDSVWNTLADFNISHKSKPKVYGFQSTKGEPILGFVKDGEIYINKDLEGCEEEKLTILEEVMHYLSDAGDKTLAFEKYLLKTIKKIALDYEHSEHVEF